MRSSSRCLVSAELATYVSAAVEGDTDAAVARKLIRSVGAEPANVYVTEGKPNLRSRVAAYNHAAHRAPWLILADLDQDASCAPSLRDQWVPNAAPMLCLRFAVRSVEAWLMADAAAFATFLGVPVTKVPSDPEAELDPKRTLVNVARQSRRTAIVKDMVPRQGGGRTVGPAYVSRIIEFVAGDWRPDVAAQRSDSLRRAIACLGRFAASS